jgi:hypothetical protein
MARQSEDDTMHKTVLSVGALALFGAMTLPASAQMCGSGQQTQAAAPGTSSMMCGGTRAVDDPMADKSQQKPQVGGMCACCKNMAMMKGGGMMDGHKNMPGMDMK